ncbi:MAG: hypothetical protein QXX95_05470 [Nitrososphaerales archaeon]
MSYDEYEEAMRRLVNLIIEYSPRNVRRLAHKLGLPVETVRYRIKKLLEKRRFRIHASLDYNKLGLVRHWAFLEFSKEYEGKELAVLRSLGQVGYLTYYCRTIPESILLAQFTLPKIFEENHQNFLEELKKIDVIKDYQLFKSKWFRHLDFKSEFYNFKNFSWDIDWGSLKNIEFKPEVFQSEDVLSYDKKDLLILGKLQIDSFTSFIDMAKKLGIERKTLLYHYHNHIRKNKLVSKYLVRWTGDIESVQRYTIIYLKAWIKNCTKEKMELAQRFFGSLPFTWSDSYSEKDEFYIADLAMPLAHYPDTLRYLQLNFGALAKELRIAIIDPNFVSAYTIPHHMFIEDIGWVFEIEKLVKIFKPLVNTIHKQFYLEKN